MSPFFNESSLTQRRRGAEREKVNAKVQRSKDAKKKGETHSDKMSLLPFFPSPLLLSSSSLRLCLFAPLR
jgi:hypothetical protein